MTALRHYRVVGGSRDIEHRPRATWIRQNLLLILTISAVAIGLFVGLALRGVHPSMRMIKLIAFPGELLMRMLKCVVVPLIVASLITGLAHLNIKDSGRIGGFAILYYLTTTTIAVMTGIILVLTIHPGDPDRLDNSNLGTSKTNPTDTMDTMLDLLRNMFPDNLLGSALQQQQTGYYCVVDGKKETNRAQCERRTAQLRGEEAKSRFIRTELLTKSGTSNILGIIVLSIAVGIVLSQMGEKARTMVDFFAILDKVSMQIISWVMWYSPVGIASLIASKVLEVEDLSSTISRLGMFCITVLTGFAIHFLFTLPLIYFALTRKSPLNFVRGMLQAMTIAFGTASSAATLPTTFRCLEENLGIDRRVTRFVLPVGATINMDGSAMYEAVATVFIAQMVGRTLNLGQVIVISLTSTLASIGAAAIPSGALVAMVMVLTAADLPIEYITLVLAVDWFLDRFRTAINVLGDAYGAAIVYHHCQRHLSSTELPMSNGFSMGQEMKSAKNGIPASIEIVAKKNRSSSVPRSFENDESSGGGGEVHLLMPYR